jgi:hypothetical protein
MHELEETYIITYDSWAGYYVVHTPKGEVRFYKDEQGLPYLDLEESSEAVVKLLQQGEDLYTDTTRIEAEAEAAVALVQMVRGNYGGYTKGEVLKAKEARRAQAMMGNPSKKDYNTMVSNNLIPECPITPTDITNARAIFGPDLLSVRGKMVRTTPAPVVADYVAVPRNLVDANKAIIWRWAQSYSALSFQKGEGHGQPVLYTPIVGVSTTICRRSKGRGYTPLQFRYLQASRTTENCIPSIVQRYQHESRMRARHMCYRHP